MSKERSLPSEARMASGPEEEAEGKAGTRPAPDLFRSYADRRTFISASLSVLTTCMTVIACLPLFAVLWMLFFRGGSVLFSGESFINWALFTETPPTAWETGGGFGNALLGTLLMVGIAAAISVPVGVFSAVLISEFHPNGHLATTLRFCAKVLSGLPSILAGVFAYATVVMFMETYSAPAGGIALSILMLPIVFLTAEESLRMVPVKMKEAAVGMGCTPTQVTWKVVLPTALPGLLTGVMLAVARAAGETAPLLFTALYSSGWILEDGSLQLGQPTASLSVLIYNLSGLPYEHLNDLAWAAALVLVLMVLATNLVGQYVSSRRIKG